MKSAADRCRALLALVLLASCGRMQSSSPGPAVVVALDGASWNVIRELWNRGQLPHLRDLAERGVSAQLQPVSSASPVIWTSIATGVEPSTHGIQGFTVQTPSGQAPVSSFDRRVPALWNMASSANLRVALLGWWASWPAEPIRGVVISDRILREENHSFYPPDLDPNLLANRIPARAAEGYEAVVSRQDRLMTSIGLQLVDADFDLFLIYLRNLDVESHRHWKYFRPQGFENEIDEASRQRLADRVPAAYAEVDAALGALVARAAPDANLFVLSDHGFQAAKGESYRIQLYLDRVLEHLGYLVRIDDRIDPDNSIARTWDSPPFTRTKLIRFSPFERAAGEPRPRDSEAVRRRLESDLQRLTYRDGSPTFRFRDLKTNDRTRGGDMVVIVRHQGVSSELYLDGEPIAGAIGQVEEISGTHAKNTEGIFIAAGPDIDADSELDRIHSLDIAPTILYALGLPVADDFDGRARTEIFRLEYRDRFPLRTVPTWGVMENRGSPSSQADEELLEELRALGYLN